MFERKKEGIAYVVEGSGESALPSIFMKGITSDETILISYDMGYGSVRYIKAIATPLSPSLENKYAQDAEFLLPEMLATNLQMKDNKGRIVVHYGLKEGEEFPTRNVLPEEHVENTENTENTVDTENATISESPEQTTQKPLTSIQAKILGDANSLWQAHLENGKISLISPPPALVYNVATWKILVKDLEFDDAGIAKIQKNIDSLPYEISISVKDGEGILTLKNLTRA